MLMRTHNLPHSQHLFSVSSHDIFLIFLIYNVRYVTTGVLKAEQETTQVS